MPDKSDKIENASAHLAEANRLHHEIESICSRALPGAGETLKAAWQAGGVLIEAKRLVKEASGHGHWENYVTARFTGSLPTAKRYMKLHKSFSTMNDLPGKSLHQVYRQLGMITGVPSTSSRQRLRPPGQHVFYARRLLAHVREALKSSDSRALKSLRGDLKILHDELRKLHDGFHDESMI